MKMDAPVFCLRFSLLLLCILGFSSPADSQTIFWTEDFNNGCPSDCLATTHNGWTVLDNIGGTTGGAPNNWFVSCAEEGITPPGCGSSCIGDASLHIGANPGAGGDMGASYNETGATNATFRLAVSPTISTVGISDITLNFDFIAYGSSLCSDDHAQLRLSADNGATWPSSWYFCLNSVCCGSCDGYSQGQWTVYTQQLPAVFDNNPNVRIGFYWRNNGNGSGFDPSVAIDDIRLSTNILPLKLIHFSAKKEQQKIRLDWTSAEEVLFSHFELERSAEGSQFSPIGRMEGKGQLQPGPAYYHYYDQHPMAGTNYYRLKMVDEDGSFTYSKIVSANGSPAVLGVDQLSLQDNLLKYRITASSVLNTDITIYDLQGKVVNRQQNRKVNAGVNHLSLNVSAFASGVYLIHVKAGESEVTEKFFKP